MFRKYSVRLKMAVDTYQDMPRAKASLVEIAPVNYVEASKKLLEKIEKLEKESKQLKESIKFLTQRIKKLEG